MKKTFTFLRPIAIGLIMLFGSGWAFGQGVFISQNCDPKSNYAPDRFAEIYNPTDASVDLNNWTLENHQNGVLSFTWTLSGSIASGEALICGNTDATNQTITPDITATWVGAGWNGGSTDGSVLKNADGDIVDFAIGSSYANGQMVRNADITSPSATYVSGEWTSSSVTNAVDATPGEHTCDLPAGGSPTITVSPTTLTGFSYIDGSEPSAEKSFTVVGADLTADISIAAPTNYEISTGTGGSFSATNPITLTQSGGAVAETTIYTRLKAGLSQGDYNDETITLSSTNATDKTVICSGIVITSAPMIINEVDADTEGSDVLEFIELYDGGTGNTPLNGLVLVLYNGSDDLSYDAAFDLDGFSTDATGYFVLGDAAVSNVDHIVSNGFIQNGADAVALYYGDGTDFPNDTPVTTTNLIDALVYDTRDSDDAGLLVLLNAAEPQVDEAGNGNSARHSNQRFPNGTGGARNTSTYGQYFPTPGIENDNWLTTWTGAPNTNWATSGNWSDGIPTVNHDVTIPTGKTPIIAASTSADCYDLTLEGDATLNIVSTSAIANGSLIFGGTYTGLATAVTYQRYFTDAKEQMFGSPFSGQAVDDAFLTANSINGMIHYLEASDKWSTNYYPTNAPGTNFVLGKGYMAKRAGSGVVNLTGTPNNAAVDLSLTRSNNGWNLLSNPFTSAIAANATDATNNLLTVNEGVLDASYTALYIWDGSAYKIINHVDGDTSVTLFQNYLQVGQGFFVRSSDPATGTFSITPAMQSHQTAIAFKSSEETSWANIILNAEINDAKESTKILFREDMSSGLDIGYDAGLFNSNPNFSLYSRLVEDNGIDFGLQCLPTDYETLIVPIGLKAKAGEIIKFSASALNIPEEYAVVLEDRTSNTFTFLTDETAEYTIQLTNDSDGTGRFFIHTSFKSALGIDDLATENAFKVFSRAKDHQLVIRGNANKNASVRIYSITGKLVTVVDLRETTENLIPFNEEAGVYIVQITNEGETQTQKFVWLNRL